MSTMKKVELDDEKSRAVSYKDEQICLGLRPEMMRKTSEAK